MARVDAYDDLEILLDRGAELIQFYRNDPVLAASDLLNVDLAPIQRIVLRDMWFKNFVITVASRGFGKSQSVDSLVYFKDAGLVYLYEVLPNIPSYLRDGEDDVIKFENEIYSSEGFVKTKYLSLEKGIKGKKLVTGYGFVNRGSNHHRLLSINKNGNFVFKRLDEFEIGDLVCLQRGSGIFGKVNIPLEDAYTLGKIVGGDKETFYNAKIDGILYEYGLDKYTEPFIFVPKIIRSSRADVVSMFLSGFFEVSENRGKDNIYIINSYDILSVIQLMLLNFGIISSLKQFGDKYKLVIKNELINVISGYGIKDYFLDEVVSIEDWKGDCYDFELDMPNTTEPNYFSNGFINHNTFLLGVNALLHALLYPGYRIGLIAPSFRQCLVLSDKPSTFITSKGIIHSTQELNNTINTGDYIFSIMDFNKVSNKWINYNRNCIRLKCEEGFELEGDENHKILVWCNNEFIYKELKNITEDDYIVLRSGMQQFIEDSHENRIITNELAYCLGLICGDGYIENARCKRRSYTICLYNSDIEIINIFVDTMYKLFGVRAKVRKRGDYVFSAEIHNKKLWKLFKTFGMFDKTASDRVVPNVLYKCGKEKWKWFLRGLYDTDGCCYVINNDKHKFCTIEYVSTSKILCKVLQSVLLNFGILSSLTIKYEAHSTEICGKMSNCERIYKLRINGADNIKMFHTEIGFNLGRKQNKLSQYIKGLVEPGFNNIIPDSFIIGNGFIDKLSKYSGIDKFELIGKDKFYKKTDFSRHQVNVLLDIADRCNFKCYEYFIFDSIIKNGFYFIKMIDKEYFIADTIDIEVDREDAYWCNGFINHNSKMIFSEVEKLYRRSSIVREAAEKKPVRGADICYLQFKGTDRSNGSYIEALPVGVDGAKIRGSRFYLIEVDELAQMPPEIIDLVVTPMAAVSLEPMQRVRELERQRELIDLGLATEEDFIDNMANKMIMSSSGYFKFNHMWDRMKSYWKAIEEGEDDKYAVHQIPYQLLPDGFLDKENIKKAKRTMSTIEFMMEYEAAMVSDSSGFFKASLIEECGTKTGFTVISRGNNESEYILGVDPNQAGRAAAGLVILEVGPPHRIIYVEGAHEKTTQANVLKIYELLKSFNIVGIFMDSMGGGKAWRDLLQEGYDNNTRILDVGDKHNTHLEGKRILHLINPTPQWISDANFNLLALLENKNLLFPELPLSADPKAEKVYDEVKTLKSQLVNIVVTQTARGIAHFDTPKKDQNKDLYSALLLAAWGVKELSTKMSEPVKQLSHSGLIRPRRPGAKFNINSYKGNQYAGALLKKTH